MNRNQIPVVVLYGGQSSEHEISLVSAASVIKNLDRERFDLIPIGIDREGRWWLNELATVDPLNGKSLQIISEGAKEISPSIFFADRKSAVVFPVLHGTHGEDGTIQGLFETLNVAYVGAGVLGSAICMDKDVAKRLLREEGLPIVPYLSFNAGLWQHSRKELLTELKENLGFPMFVKAANLGSSVGCRKVKVNADLVPAIEYAFQFDHKVLVEQAVNAREVECSVLENTVYGASPRVSVPGEIITKHEFYDYEAKYHDDSLQLVIPAKISSKLTKNLQTLAAAAFEILECNGMARVDFFIDKDTQKIYINELNTIPGFTHVSMYPMMWEATGLPYKELLSTLVELAMSRRQRHSRLILEKP